MPQTSRCLFRPKPTDEFVGEILYRCHGRAETDHDLYIDHDTRAAFVVSSESRASGPAWLNSHTRQTVGEFLDAHPGHRRRVDDLLRGRLQRCGPAPVRRG
jgi:hypothetical protein